MFIEIEITPEMLLTAQQKSKEMGVLRNSIMKGQGNLAGFLGEEIVLSYLGCPSNNSFDYDLIKNHVKIDVKTKQTTVTPLPHYEASVAAYNPNQRCDLYIFTRVLKGFSKGWICGWLTKEEYFGKAQYLRKGQIDPSNGFRVRANCHNVAYQDLKRMDDLILFLEKKQL
jgi:hypothetical protein